MLSELEATKQQRVDLLLKNRFPAYTTSVGWMGYSEDEIRHLSREAKNIGWTHYGMKVGSDINEGMPRAEIIREEIR